MKNRDRGKRHERVIAEQLNGKRIGTMCGEDVMHPKYSIECKSRQTFVGCGWMDQAKRHCPIGKVPLVILHVHGKRHNEDLVLIRLEDFKNESN